jgi:micrococcal nuclease
VATTSPHRRTRRQVGATWVALVVLAVTAAACGDPTDPVVVTIPGTDQQGLRVEVTEVVDGDTLALRLPGGEVERARILGIDTPETVHPDRPVECFGPEASARALDLVPPGTEVLVQRDVEARDRFGRLLVYVWRLDDGLFFNHAMVAEGFAETLSIAPNDAHRAGLSAAAAEARAAGLGLWSSCPPESAGTGPG